ncbi:MAG: hypothetical protein QME90_12235, partial [Thermodesulfobacteriota bacterium]|nr:hypothetical protein [Thermodesulfobacteriota bacterium]
MGRKEKKVKARGRALTAEEILRLMEDEDRPLLLREILQRFGLGKEERRTLRERLRDLSEEGKVVKIRGNRY